MARRDAGAWSILEILGMRVELEVSPRVASLSLRILILVASVEAELSVIPACRDAGAGCVRKTLVAAGVELLGILALRDGGAWSLLKIQRSNDDHLGGCGMSLRCGALSVVEILGISATFPLFAARLDVCGWRVLSVSDDHLGVLGVS